MWLILKKFCIKACLSVPGFYQKNRHGGNAPLGDRGADAAALLNLASQLATEPTGKAPITKPARPMAVRMKRSTAKKGTTQAPMDN